MKWKPVSGPGDLLRGIPAPDQRALPIDALLRNDKTNSSDYDWLLKDAMQRWSQAAWRQQQRRDRIRDSSIGPERMRVDNPWPRTKLERPLVSTLQSVLFTPRDPSWLPRRT